MSSLDIGSRWVKSKYSDGIRHARLKNYIDPTRDIVIELEADSAGNVYGSWRFGTEHFEVNEGNHMPGFKAAAEASLREVQSMFQTRMKSNVVLDFLPYVKMRELAAAFGVSLGTASGWTSRKSPKPKQVMSRRTITQAMTLMGFRFKGRGNGAEIRLDTPSWEEDNA